MVPKFPYHITLKNKTTVSLLPHFSLYELPSILCASTVLGKERNSDG
jgi:hypothetical protein